MPPIPGHAAKRSSLAQTAALVLFATLAATLLPLPALGAESCFRACTSGRISSSDNDIVMRDAMRGCRQSCLDAEKHALEAEGLYDRYATCRPTPVSDAEFRTLRSGNPGFTVQINVLVWELKNLLPDKVIRSVEITTQTMNLSDAAFTTRTVIPPAHAGTIVVMDFFDGYPNARYAAKVSRIEACPAQ